MSLPSLASPTRRRLLIPRVVTGATRWSWFVVDGDGGVLANGSHARQVVVWSWDAAAARAALANQSATAFIYLLMCRKKMGRLMFLRCCRTCWIE